MPIANCILSAECYLKKKPSEKLIQLWSHHSGQSDQYMTINFIKAEQQIGSAYHVMADLSLPSIWAEDKRNQLQLGLAKALAGFFEIEPVSVHIKTTVLAAGQVVENGEILNW